MEPMADNRTAQFRDMLRTVVAMASAELRGKRDEHDALFENVKESPDMYLMASGALIKWLANELAEREGVDPVAYLDGVLQHITEIEAAGQE
jgi:hypothetical protein